MQRSGQRSWWSYPSSVALCCFNRYQTLMGCSLTKQWKQQQELLSLSVRHLGEVQQPALKSICSCNSLLTHGMSSDAQTCPENALFHQAELNTEFMLATLLTASTSGTPPLSICFSKSYLYIIQIHLKSERKLFPTKLGSRNKIIFQFGSNLAQQRLCSWVIY